MILDRPTAVSLIISTLKNFGLPNPPAEFNEDTLLFGRDGLFDSVALVSFILDVEEGVRQACGVNIALADERAMSQTRSPFRRVSSLADYAVQLVAEQASKS